MSLSVNLNQVSNSLCEISGTLCRDTVMALPKKGFWMDKALSGQAVELSLSNTTYADSAGLAWLVNLVKACKANNISLTISHFPESLLKLAKISDVDHLLPLQ